MAYENIKNQRADGELNLTSEEIKEFVANSTPEELPKALLRPGRINQVAEVGYLQEGKRGSSFILRINVKPIRSNNHVKNYHK